MFFTFTIVVASVVKKVLCFDHIKCYAKFKIISSALIMSVEVKSQETTTFSGSIVLFNAR